MLAHCYGIQELAVHNPADISWEDLPASIVLQLHWHRTEELTALLDRYGFRVVTLARHPHDLLLSVLQFAAHEPATASWLLGEGGNERTLIEVTPNSAAFLEYAVGARAKALLSVSTEWWQAPDVIGAKYEDLVENTHQGLAALVQSLEQQPYERIGDAIRANTLEKQRPFSTNSHFWQGRPGLWRKLLTNPTAMRIYTAHLGVFMKLGYICDPDLELEATQADQYWKSLQR
jgi:hypothetical protein